MHFRRLLYQSPGTSEACHGRRLKNLLTDIAGVRVGHADDARLASGVTAVIFDKPAVASIDVRGGGPGTREDALLQLDSTVEAVDAIALSGGSALGLDAAGGVQAWLAEQGRGLRIRDAVIPIVPGAICFDLLNGGDKAWGRFPPYRDLGHAAAAAASGEFALGSAGAGMGGTTANFKGGIGSASAATGDGVMVAALAVVNKRKWRVVDARAPQAGRREGHIEAVARTPIMGFRDDVSIRVRAETDGARIDARSSSRYGSFDFGTNASRVRGLMNEIEDAIRAQRPERPPAQPSAKKSTPGKKDQSKK